MALPLLQIGDLTVRLPIVQGGMAVGISMHRLASAVATQGGVGVIAGAMIGIGEADVGIRPTEANIRVLKKEIRLARGLSDGALGVNIMVALTDFAALARAAIEEKIDIIFSGAGLPMDLPKHLLELCEEKKEEFKTKLVPIVSSGRAAHIICKKWFSRYGVLPDAFVLEGPKAGGHLGFKPEELDSPDFTLEKLLPETVDAVKSFEDQTGKPIPVIAAGGVYNGEDIYRMLEMGASGVQMATRFVATHECDADERFKQAFIKARPEDLTIIKSPVGMPGRAIKNRFLEALAEKKRNFRCIFHCVHTCDPDRSPYCIASALLNAMRGNLEKGFAFAGANAGRIMDIISVRELMESLQQEFETAKNKWLK
ncbi:MAG: nitronate monooxygenase family protein [Desulfovibrionaceae bacterium]|nr:nitronate monooxygenase family protein [Desulfovibrionaceae bacterium]